MRRALKLIGALMITFGSIAAAGCGTTPSAVPVGTVKYVATSTTLPKPVLVPTTETSQPNPAPYETTTTTDYALQLQINQDESNVSNDQAAVDKDQENLSEDQDQANIDNYKCTNDEQLVQANEESPNLDSDEQQESFDCSHAQSDESLVESDSTRLQLDESTLEEAEQVFRTLRTDDGWITGLCGWTKASPHRALVSRFCRGTLVMEAIQRRRYAVAPRQA